MADFDLDHVWDPDSKRNITSAPLFGILRFFLLSGILPLKTKIAFASGMDHHNYLYESNGDNHFKRLLIYGIADIL